MSDQRGLVFSTLNNSNGTKDNKKGKRNSSSSTEPDKESLIKKRGLMGEKNVEENHGCTKAAGESSDHEIHIWTERERRKKMRTMFSNLHALLPQLPPKVDKSTIVDEAVNYIKTLETTLQNLQKQKHEKQLQASTTFTNTNNTSKTQASSSRESFLADQVSTNSNLSTITTTTKHNSPVKTNLDNNMVMYPVMFQTWTSTNVVLNICGDEAQISVCSAKKTGLFTAICYVLEKHNIDVVSVHVSSDCKRCFCMIQAHANEAIDIYGEAFPVEEIYRQAAAEIMCWVSS